MQALSLDLRERIIKRWQEGQPKAAIARVFLVSLSSVKRYVKQFQTEGHVRPKAQPTLRPGQIIILDNLSSHKTERGRNC